MKLGTCGRCGFPIKKSTALKSRYTQSIYCPDINDCDRRSRNKLKLDEMNVVLGGLWGMMRSV